MIREPFRSVTVDEDEEAATEAAARASEARAPLWFQALTTIPYFVYGGFVVSLAAHGIRTLFLRRFRFGLPHALTFVVAAYLVVNLLLVQPRFEEFPFPWEVFLRWQLREVAPLVALLVVARAAAKSEIEDYIRMFLRVGAILTGIGVVAYAYSILFSADNVLWGMVRLQVNGERFFFAWLRAHNAAGGLYAVAAVISLSWYLRKQVSPWIFVANAVGLALTGSRSAYVAMVVATAFLFLSSRSKETLRRLVLAGALVLAAVSLTLLPRFQDALEGSDRHIASRFVVWDEALDDLSQSPIIGVGWGNFQSRYHFAEPGIHAHNSYLHVLAELGVLGFFLLGAWLTSVLWPLMRFGQRDVLLGLAVVAISSLAEHNFGSPTISVPIFIFAGLSLSLSSGQRRSSSGGRPAPSADPGAAE